MKLLGNFAITTYWTWWQFYDFQNYFIGNLWINTLHIFWFVQICWDGFPSMWLQGFVIVSALLVTALLQFIFEGKPPSLYCLVALPLVAS